MSIEEMQMASTLCFVLAGILGVLAGFLFFSWNVRKLIGDMTGSNARKEIQTWREENRKIQVWKEEKTTLLRGESICYLVEEYCFLASEEIIH